MKRISTLIFFILVCSNIYSAEQTTTVIDSLENILSKTKDKKAKIELLIQLINESSSKSLDKSLKYGEQALTLSKKLKNEKKELEILIKISDSYTTQNKFNEAIETYFKALQLSQKTKDYESTASIFNGIGLNYYLMGNYNEALKYFNKAIAISTKHAVKKEMGHALVNIGQVFRKMNDTISAIENFKKAINTFKEINYINGLIKCYANLGNIEQETGNYRQAIVYYEKCKDYCSSNKDKKIIAGLNNNIGNAYLIWGKLEEAIEYYQKALNISEEIGLNKDIARCSNNIGLLYEELSKKKNKIYFDKAYEYHLKALNIWQSLGDDFEIAGSLNNIGNLFFKQTDRKLDSIYGVNWQLKLSLKERKEIKREYSKAHDYYTKSLVLRENLKDKRGIALLLSNLGKIYNNTGSYSDALVYFNKALKIDEEINNRYEISRTLSEIGSTYYNLNIYQKAIEYQNKSLEIAQKNEIRELIQKAYLSLSDIYMATGNYYKSIIAYKRHVEIQDSMLNENSMKQLAEMQTLYETAKKEGQIQLLNKDAEIKDIEIKQKNTAIYFFVVGMLSILVITVLLIKQNKERQKTNIELATKNKLITEQKEEITDSIHYASRIQSAVMPSKSHIKDLIPDSFIFFKPRDIVSGDFYWTFEKNGKIIVAAADCTGHGVPGAFMSMMGITLLNNIVAENENIHSDELLNELRSRIIKSLHQTGETGENKDGMDMALYIYDPENLSIEYSGANNPLYIIREGELIETKADKMPIGIHDKSNISFTRHNLLLQKKDMLYTFSDGYHDQFGGPNGKKFMSANLKKLLNNIYNEPVEKQFDIVGQTISEWMKNHYQVDDMLIIGVRV